MLQSERPIDVSSPLEVVVLSSHARGAALRDHHHVVGVRREGEAGVRERRDDPGREGRRRRQGRAGRGGKLVRGGIRLADLDVEGVVLGVLGVNAHAGERVAGRVGPRVEQLRMFVATGAGVCHRPIANELLTKDDATSAPPPRPPREAAGPRRGRWRWSGLDGRAAGRHSQEGARQGRAVRV